MYGALVGECLVIYECRSDSLDILYYDEFEYGYVVLNYSSFDCLPSLTPIVIRVGYLANISRFRLAVNPLRLARCPQLRAAAVRGLTR
jgi:hypothetical protein